MPVDLHAPAAQPDFACRTLTGAACSQFAVQDIEPQFVLEPETEQEVAGALKVCAERGLAVVPWGGGTLMSIGAPLRHYDVALSMARMNQVIAYEPADLTMAVQAGCTLQTLKDTLASHGQMLPFDAAEPERATVGGLVATNIVGPRRFGSGSFRDLLIGIHVASPEGTVTKAGGMVVKNVSGYDLMKLHLGALGSLGVLTRLNFKVLTAPDEDHTGVVEGSLADLCTLGAVLAGSQAKLDSLELISANAVTPSVVQWRLATRVTGSPAGVARKQRLVEAAATDLGLGVEWLDVAAGATLWQRCAGFIGAQAGRGEEALVRMMALPAQLSSLINTVLRMAAAAGLITAVVAHVGDGMAYVRLASGSHMLIEGLPVWLSGAQAEYPHCVVLSSPLVLHRTLPVWGAATSGDALMRHIKAVHDPADILNPGRLFA